MAFGKDKTQLDKVSPYGGSLSQKAAMVARGRGRGGGGKGAPFWVDNFKVPQHTSRIGRLIPGQYVQQVAAETEGGEPAIQEVTLEYVYYREHFMGGQGSGICSAGPLYLLKEHRNECRGCDIYWEDYELRGHKKKIGDTSKGPNRISMRDVYAFNWYDYGVWYKVPVTDKNGQVRTNNKGEPFTRWEAGEQGDPRYAGFEAKAGHLIAWPMGVTYRDQLFLADNYVKLDCKACHQQRCMQITGRACRSCGQQTHSAQELFDPAVVQMLDTTPHTCQHCGVVAFAKETMLCSNCGNTERANIFDVDLQIQSTKSSDEKKATLNIINRSAPQDFQVQGIEPLDLLSKFSPTPIDTQKKNWGSTTEQNPAVNQGPAHVAPNNIQQSVPQMAPQMQVPMQQQMTIPGVAPQPVQYAQQPQQAPMMQPAPQQMPMAPPAQQPQLPNPQQLLNNFNQPQQPQLPQLPTQQPAMPQALPQLPQQPQQTQQPQLPQVPGLVNPTPAPEQK